MTQGAKVEARAEPYNPEITESERSADMKTTRVYITAANVADLLGCQKTKAYKVIKAVNEEAAKRGLCPFGQGKANKYLLSDLYGIPIDDINNVIEKG